MARQRDILRAPWSSARRAGGSIPTIRTNPPSGTALTPYSVSPLRVDHRVLPNPTMNSVHLMPNILAVAMWPSSCQAIENSSPRTSRMTPTTVNSTTMYLSSSQVGPQPRASSSRARVRAQVSAA